MNFTLKTTWKDFLEAKELSTEDFDALEALKKDDLSNEFNQGMNEVREKAIESKADKADLDKLQKEIQESQALQFKNLNEAVKNLSIMGKGVEKQKTFKAALSSALKDNSEAIKNVANGGDKVRIAVKAPVVMGDYNTIEASGSASQTSITQDTGIISALRKRILTYLSEVSINTLTVDEPFLMWIEELDEQGAPIFVGEEDISPDASVRYEERTAKAKTVAAAGTVTKDLLRYSNSLYNYIQNNLLKRLDIVVENGLFTGDGTGDNLKGLTEYATAFDGGVGVKGGDGLVGKVDNATNWDVLKAVALQVYNSYGTASAVFIDSGKMAEMEVAKDANNNYIMPPFKSADGTMVSGMKLIPTTASLGTGIDFIGGDLSAVNVGLLLDTEIEIGRNGNDLKNRQYTIVVERQLVQFVSANDTQVLVKGGFTAGKALLETT